MAQGELLDLVCGPASPLPETYQRYRLVAHLGSGGQAEVYRAVRLCGGVSSAPMTVKVFRVDPARPLADELRSWDKGDAALMDLNNRGVGGICRRADGFYGPPPHRPGERPPASEAVPYQIYDYLHGVNLREYITSRAGLAPGARRLSAVATLGTLAGVLRAIHHPQQTGATPVLHMDVKPSNVMVLTTGEIRLIDFTGARYWRAEEITQIAYTPESGGPEAFGGASQVGPAYDVHGFGAVAYFLVTGEVPRVEPGVGRPGGSSPPPWSVLRRHPVLERLPALRDHLHAPLADHPGDRPRTPELVGWLSHLVALLRRTDVLRQAGAPDVGVDWSEPGERSVESSRAYGRATPRPPVTGTETEAFQRIERLERELVELRAAANGAAPIPRTTPAGAPVRTLVAAPVGPLSGLPGGPGSAMAAGSAMPGGAGPGRPVSAPPVSAAPMSGPPAASASAPPSGPPAGGGPFPPAPMRGRAAVPVPRPVTPENEMVIDPVRTGQSEPWRPPNRDDIRILKRGSGMTVTGALIAFVSWGIWSVSSGVDLAESLIAFVLVLAVAAGVFTLTRLVGRFVVERWLNHPRRTARGAHALTGFFLTAAGVAYLRSTPWVMAVIDWLSQHVW